MSPAAEKGPSTLTPIAIAAILILLVTAACVALFFNRHRHVERVSARRAEAEFHDLRARFSGQHPLLDMGERRVRTEPEPFHASAKLHSFHAVIFDTRGSGRLVRINLPYGLLRCAAVANPRFQYLGQLTLLDDTEFDQEPIRRALQQIERHGPGLAVDYRHPGGGQFLAWVD